MTTTNDLYQASLSNMAENVAAKRWRSGNARKEMNDGSTLICYTAPVAGRSQVRSHYRTTWHLVANGEKFSKPIGKARVTQLLRAQA